MQSLKEGSKSNALLKTAANPYEVGMWQTYKLSPNNPSYNLAFVAELREKSETNLLEQALEWLIRQYPYLKSTYQEDNGVLYKVLHKTSPVKLNLIHKSCKKDELNDVLRKLIDQPFNLTSKCAIRFVIVKQESDDSHTDTHHLLLITAHHILLDFYSFDKIILSLTENYQKIALNLSTEDSSFSKAAFYNNVEAISPNAEGWWRTYLYGAPATIDLSDHSNCDTSLSSEGKTIEFNLEKNRTQGLKKAAQQGCVTPFIYTLSVFFLTLHYFSRQEDLIVGVPVKCQTEEKYLGNSINPIPFRTRILGNQSFLHFLHQIKETYTSIQPYKACPFQLIAKQQPSLTQPTETPVFQIMFAWDQPTGDRSIINHSSLEIFDTPLLLSSTGITGAPYRMMLSVYASKNEFKIKWTYQKSFYSDDFILRLGETFLEVLLQTTTNIHLPISEIEYIPKRDLRLIINDFNNTTQQLPSCKTVNDFFEDSVSKFADRIALIYLNKDITYRELKGQVQILACGLRKEDIKKGAIVAVLIDRSDLFVLAALSILKIGAAYLPIDTATPKTRISYILNQSGANLVLITKSQQHLLNDIDLKIKSIALDTINWNGGAQLSPFLSSPAGPDDPAYVIYTSGSTGAPKGVINTHMGLLNRILWMKKELSITDNDAFIFKTSISFDVSVWEYLLPLICGAKIIIVKENDQKHVEKLIELIEEHRVSIGHFVPSMLHAFLANIQGSRLQSLKYIIASGEILTKETIRYFNKKISATLYNFYGPTEAAIDVTYWKCLNIKQERPVPIGYPIDNIRIYILDKYQRLVPIGVTGEIYIAGAGLAKGYINNAPLTEKSFIHIKTINEKILYHTGDLGYWQEDGSIVYAGRIDRQIKLRGFRIELGEIENVLLKCPMINEAAAAIKGEEENQFIEAYVVTSSTENYIIENAFSLLRQHLPYYMVPANIHVIQTMPRLLSGKIDYTKLLGINSGPANPIKHSHLPLQISTHTEAFLAKLWSELFKKEISSAEENFFYLGGNSILIINMINIIKDRLKIQIKASSIFNNPTLQVLAKFIDEIKAYKPPQIPLAKGNKSVSFYKNGFPLTDIQQQIYFMHEYGSGSATYSIPRLFHLNGNINYDLLKKSIYFTLNEEPYLKTRLTLNNDLIKQKIDQDLNLNIDWHDYSKKTQPDRDNFSVKHLKSIATIPFNLYKDPLVRIYLVKVDKSSGYLLFNIHHIICDGWSIAIILKRLTEVYHSFLENIAPPTREVVKNSTFVEYVIENSSANTDKHTTATEYWQKKFQLVSDVVTFPYDIHNTYKTTSTQSGSIKFDVIKASLFNEITTYSKRCNQTNFITLLSAFFALVYQYTGRNDITIGTTFANRQDERWHDTIGCFTTTLPIKLLLNESDSLQEIQDKTKTEIATIMDYQSVSLMKIKKILKANSNPLRKDGELFKLLFIFLDGSEFTCKLTGINIENKYVDNKTTKFDLITYAISYKDKIDLVVQYSTAKYSSSFIRNLTANYNNLLHKLVSNSTKAISDLSILTYDGLLKITAKHNKLSSQNNYHSISEWIDIIAKRYKNKAAYKKKDTAVSYGELSHLIAITANFLIKTGVEAGENVALYFEPSLHCLVSILAILRIGACYIPLDSRWPSQRIKFIINDCKVDTLLTCQKFCNQQFSIERTIFIEDVFKNAAHISTYINCNYPSKSHTAYIIYTSGSTGLPKGVRITHANLLHLFNSTNTLFDFNENDNWTWFHSYAFDFSVWEIFGSLLHGACLVPVSFHQIQRVEEFYNLLIKEKITILNQTPSAFVKLIEYEKSTTLIKTPRALYLRYICFGGEKLEFSLLRDWIKNHPLKKISLINMYGNTECTIHSTFYQLTNKDIKEGNRSLIGKPLPGYELVVLDDHFNIVPPGKIGELYIGGESVTQGYLNRTDINNSVFFPNLFNSTAKFYKTGDYVKYSIDGTLEYLHRKDSQIKFLGYRIELEEISYHIRQIPHVKNAVVTFIKNTAPSLGEIVAYVLTEKNKLDTEALRRLLSQKIPAYMIPQEIIFIDAFPLNENGKIDNVILLKKYTQYKKIATQNKASPNIEDSILKIWKDILKRKKIGINDNFFHIGGDSILAIRLTHELKKNGFDIGLKEIFANPTIKELALTTHNSNRETHSTNGIKINESFGLLPMQAWFFEKNHQHFNQWVHYVTLELDNFIKESTTLHAIKSLTYSYDAFYLNFDNSGNTYRQRYNRLEKNYLIKKITTTHFSKHQTQIIQSVCEEINITTGPLTVFLIISDNSSNKRYLSIIIHHLIIDAISWTPLLTKLSNELSSPSNLRYPEILTKQYVDYYQKYVANINQATISYWLDIAKRFSKTESPLDIHRIESYTEGETHYKFRIEIKKLEKIKHTKTQVFHNEIFAFLLSSFLIAYHKVTSKKFIAVMLETSARETYPNCLQPENFLGWISGIYPFIQEISVHKNSYYTFLQIADELANVPDKGLSFTPLRYCSTDHQVRDALSKANANICINYLGEIGEESNNSKNFFIKKTGYYTKKGNKRLFQYEVNIINTKHGTDIFISHANYDKIFVEKLVFYWKESANLLAKEISAKLQYETSFLTYQLAPLQKTWFSYYSADINSNFHFNIATWEFHGHAKPELIKMAWENTLSEYDIFKISFYDPVNKILHQKIHSTIITNFQYIDYSAISKEQLKKFFDMKIEEEKMQSLSISQPTPMRIYLIKVAKNRYKVLWSMHQALLDGWSITIFLKRFIEHYTNLTGEHTTSPDDNEPYVSYRAYLDWLQYQSKTSSLDFWKGYLTDKKFQPAFINGSYAFSDMVKCGDSYQKQIIYLKPNLIRKLNRIGQLFGVTLNTLFHAAWSFYLFHTTKSLSCTYGLMVSGRTNQFDGISGIVGLLSNLLPIYINIDHEKHLKTWLHDIQKSVLHINLNSNISLSDIIESCDMNKSLLPFDHVLNFQNYPDDPKLMHRCESLKISSVDIYERANFPLVIRIIPGTNPMIKFTYNNYFFDNNQINEIAVGYFEFLNKLGCITESSSNITVSFFTLCS